jgi:predicted methyltransferase
MTFSRKGPAHEARVRSSGVRKGMTVLDYAQGPGYFAVIAARLVGPTG